METSSSVVEHHEYLDVFFSDTFSQLKSRTPCRRKLKKERRRACGGEIEARLIPRSLSAEQSPLLERNLVSCGQLFYRELVAGGKNTKEGPQTVIFTPSDTSGDDTCEEYDDWTTATRRKTTENMCTP